MPNRVSRRESRIRLYYFRELVARMASASGDPLSYDWPAAFNVDAATLDRWIRGEEAVPAWIPALAIQAFRVPPPPPRSRVPVLVRWILLVVAAGAAAVFTLARLTR